MLPPSVNRLVGFMPLVATRARQRMAVLSVTALLFSLFTAGSDVILPLWVTRALQYTPAQWAQLRSLRMAGVLVGVIILGGLSDRFGQRVLAVFSMLGTALILIVLGMGWTRGIWLVMPVFGALVSTAFVNLNTLTQQISDRRQGLANTIYRSVGAAAGIVAPVLATGLAALWGGYSAILLVCAGLLVVAACALFRYPDEPVSPRMGAWQQEIRGLLGSYLLAVRQRELVWFILVSQVWGNILIGVGTFAAIRFTQQLGQTDQQFGLLSGIAGVVGFLATAGAGFYLDRVSLRQMHGVVAVLASLGSVLMGIGDSIWFSVIGFLAFGPLSGMLVAPSSMWISRAAGAGTQTAAFTVHKVFSATLVAISMLVLKFLEPVAGMRTIFLFGGLLGLPSALAFFLLPEPPRPGTGSTPPSAP